jgi:hypothetical protein
MCSEAGVIINVKFPSFLSDFNKIWNKCREIIVQRHVTAFRGYQLRDVRRHTCICELADGGADGSTVSCRIFVNFRL